MPSPLNTGRLSVEPQGSVLHCLLLAILYLLVAYIVIWLKLEFWLTLFLALALLISFFDEICTHGRRVSKNAIAAVECEHGAWLIRYRNGTNRRFERVESAVVLDWLVVLNFRHSLIEKISIPVFTDSLPVQDFRHLRGYLNLRLDCQDKVYPKLGGTNTVSTGSVSVSG